MLGTELDACFVLPWRLQRPLRSMLPSLPEASDDSTAAGVWKQQFPLESALLLHVAPLGHPYWAMFQSPENQVRKLNALGLFASDEF